MKTKKENEAGEFLGTQKSKMRHEASREKEKLRMDETQQIHEKEEERKRKNSNNV